MIKHTLRCARPDAGQKLHHPEARDLIKWVLDKAQQCKHVFHVRRFKEFKSAKFHEWNFAAGKFDLQRTAVGRRSEQDCLPF